MLEYIEVGIMGSGEMEKWVFEGIPLDMEAEIVHK